MTGPTPYPAIMNAARALALAKLREPAGVGVWHDAASATLDDMLTACDVDGLEALVRTAVDLIAQWGKDDATIDPRVGLAILADAATRHPRHGADDLATRLNADD